MNEERPPADQSPEPPALPADQPETLFGGLLEAALDIEFQRVGFRDGLGLFPHPFYRLDIADILP